MSDYKLRDTESITREVTALYREYRSNSKIQSVEQIAGDMSPRRYFRITTEAESAIAMVFDSRAVPEAGGQTLDSYEAVVALTDYLLKCGLPVPKIFAASDETSIIIEEDFGDTFLADFLVQNEEGALGLYKQAIDLIIKLQSEEIDRSFFAFQRGFTEESYLKEMEETIDFYLPWKLKRSVVTPPRMRELLSFIANRVFQQPTALALRDYHSWNLMATSKGLGVIDFQDALIAPECYDVVALLNDRDTDALLGEKNYQELLEYFFAKHPNKLKELYPFVLLQRDLKVAGRLAKMVLNRGLTRYERWIPGTARRIERTLRASPVSECQELLQIFLSIDETFGS